MTPAFDEKLILVVEDTFELTGLPGTTLTPHVHRDYEVGDYEVVLHHPDLEDVVTIAHISRVHFNPGGFQLVCRLPALSKDQVPVGTKVRRTRQLATDVPPPQLYRQSSESCER